MAARDRSPSLDRQLRHQHSSSESGRLSVPMWDSSDPDRAPPPLPLNPGTASPQTSPVRSNASSNVAAAAQALVERARENLASSYTTNANPKRSPERSPVRTSQHRRLQSLQNAGLHDVGHMLDSASEGSSTRPASPRSLSRDREGSATPTLKPSARPPPRPLLEHTPPSSATLLAMHAMKVPDGESPLGDITNASTPTRPPQNLESIHKQMINLTTIANTLQQEMATLSRRSKDNATDLISLKEATKTRDEDIRSSLRELVNNAHTSKAVPVAMSHALMARPNRAPGDRDDFREGSSGESLIFSKSVPLPRFSSLPRFESASENNRSAGSTAPPVQEASALAMLEKILREMTTKSGQDRIFTTLSEMFEHASKQSSDTLHKLVELVESLRQEQPSTALVRHGGLRNAQPKEETQAYTEAAVAAPRSLSDTSITQQSPHPLVSEELSRLLQKMKDSIMQSGGMTGEVKSLIRELRGEVLGMGRELGRKLEKAEKEQHGPLRQQISRDDVARIVQEGLDDLRGQMTSVIHTRRRQSNGTTSSESSEIYDVVKHVLADQGVDNLRALQTNMSVDRESILAAVKEACEAYKPEIELQQFGLERDEILQCLREGLEDYQSSRPQVESATITREDIFGAVQDAVQGFSPPQPAADVTAIKDEVIVAFKECLEDFKHNDHDRSVGQSTDFNRNDILDAVKDGLGVFRREGAREIEISPQDLYQAVRTGLESMDNPFGQYGNQVINSLHEIVEGMRVEFKQYSEANGRDTEQVLDAMKDGLEALRNDVETYVDRARNVTGKDEIMDKLSTEFRTLQTSFDNLLATRALASTAQSELAVYIKGEFESVHERLNEDNESRNASQPQTEHIIGAIDNYFARLKLPKDGSGLEESTEEHLEALRAEFDQLREATLNGTARHRDEILDSIQDSIAGLHARIGTLDVGAVGDDDTIRNLREDINALRGSMSVPVLRSNDQEPGHDESIRGIKDALEGLRVQLLAEQGESANETLGLIRNELESFREAIGGSLMLSSPGLDQNSISEAVQSGLESLKADLDWTTGESTLRSVTSELENLRTSLSNTLVQTGSTNTTAEIVEILRSGFEEVKENLARQVVVPNEFASLNEDALHAMNDNFGSLKVELAKMADKPVDMTVSYEILDTLKEGFSHVRTELDKLRSGTSPVGENGVVLADSAKGGIDYNDASAASSAQTIKRTDIEKLEVGLTQLQIKLEAMDQSLQAGQAFATTRQTSINPAEKNDIENIGTQISQVAQILSRLAEQKNDRPPGSVTKEDTDAIETLLVNTKAKIDEQVVSRLKDIATQSQADNIEAAVRLTNDVVEGLAARGEDLASLKDDMPGLALLMHEAADSINELKASLARSEDDSKGVKQDVETIETLCNSLKNSFEDLPETMPSKADIEELREFIAEFRSSHNQLKDRYEGDISITAKAFDDRKDEASAIMEQIESLKDFVQETRDHLKSRMKRGSEDVRVLDEILQGIEERIDAAPDIEPHVEELKESVKSGFERAQAALEEMKTDNDAKNVLIHEKTEQHREQIIAQLAEKLELYFGQVATRQNEQQVAYDETTRAMAEKANQQDDLLTGSKAMAEELKVTIDTLGASIGVIAPALAEATDKMGDDSKTVFNRVDDMHSKLCEVAAEGHTEHQHTRNEVSKAVATVAGLHEDLTTHNPKVLGALDALMLAVDRNFEHTKTFHDTARESSDGLKAHLAEELKRLPAPQADATKSLSQYDEARILSKLDEILQKDSKSDNSGAFIRTEFQDLLDRAVVSIKSDLPSAKLDEVHQQVLATASDISAFLALQTEQRVLEHASKAMEADRAAQDLSQHLNEKERVNAEVEALKTVKDSLNAEVAALKSEHSQLASQKSLLAADISSLETALRIRREELHMMDSRADALERRIIEGVMDHSRALLIAKAPKKLPKLNLKRVSSSASTSTAATATLSTVNSGVGMALQSRTGGRQDPSAIHQPSRRIVSLSQITGNAPARAKTVSTVPKNAGALTNMKRSQSVRTQKLRKASWTPQSHNSLADDKENSVLSEESETDYAHGDTDVSDVTRSSASRQTSHGTSFSGSLSGTGSYFTGTETDRRTSYASTVRSHLGRGSSLENFVHEEGDEDCSEHSETEEVEENTIEQETRDQVDNELATPKSGPSSGLVLQHPDGYDSGLGSDLPTATWSSTMESEYFKPIKEVEGA